MITMTAPVTAHTRHPDSVAAGRDLGTQIARGLGGERPDALIVFASPVYEYEPFLAALDGTCRPRRLVGCSSSGEFSSAGNYDGSACALALRSDALQFSAGIGRGVGADRERAAREVIGAFRGLDGREHRYRTALVLTDVLAGYVEDLLEHLTLLTGGAYQFCGGGAGDDARFERTHVFLGTEAATDAVVALEILSETPIGIGASHGWQPAGPGMRVTEADGARLVSLNAAPAVEAFQEHAEATGQQFDTDAPLPFFLHNLVGVDTGDGYKLRVPLALHGDGSLSCAAKVPEGITARIMATTHASAAEAATIAARAARAALEGRRPRAALFFDCAATRLRLGRAFENELHALEETLGSTPYAGCNTFGQIVRAHGQFSGFHNCTAVVCLIPE